MDAPLDPITLDTILADAEYDVRPGLGYEVAAGLVAHLKAPSEAVIEAFEALGQEAAAQGPEAAVRRLTYQQAAAVLAFPDGFDPARDAGRLLFPVCDRVAADFFWLSRPRMSRQMRSFAETAARLRAANGSPVAGTSSDGPSGSLGAAADGPTAPSS